VWSSTSGASHNSSASSSPASVLRFLCAPAELRATVDESVSPASTSTNSTEPVRCPRPSGIQERVGELTASDLDQAERDLDAVWSRWTPEHTRLRDVLAARRAELTAADNPVDATEPVSAEQ